MNKLNTTNIALVASVVALATLGIAEGMASSHEKNSQFDKSNLSIDPFITGTNKGSLKLENLPKSSIDKDNCPLCYHRELMKNNDSKNIPEQPFPGE